MGLSWNSISSTIGGSPHTIDPAGHIGRPGNPWWPKADQTPWDEAAEWYAQVIEYSRSARQAPRGHCHVVHDGQLPLGARAEPVLWNDTNRPEIEKCTERFVKVVWPAFCSAGKRPEGRPNPAAHLCRRRLLGDEDSHG